MGRILFPDRAVSIWSRLFFCLVSPSPHRCRSHPLQRFISSLSVFARMICPFFCPFFCASLLGTCCSLACGPRDVVLINSPDCTLIKLSVNGPAPGFPPGVRQDGSHRKQLQIYGTAVAAARPALPVEPGNGEATACNSSRKCRSARCSHFNMRRYFSLPSQSSIFLF